MCEIKLKRKIKTSKNKGECSSGFRVRVCVPGDDFINNLSYEPIIKNHTRLVNDLRHASKVYVKIDGVRIRGMYDKVCRSLCKDKYFLVKERIYSDICKNYPYLTYAVYRQRKNIER